MLRKLTIEDKGELYAFLKHRASENLFMLWGIEAFGIDADIQTFWGEYNPAGELIGVLYKFKDKYTPYGTDSFDIEQAARFILNDESAKLLAGIESITVKFKPYLKGRAKESRSHLYAELKPNQTLKVSAHSEVRLANASDVPKIIELYKKIPEFQHDRYDSETMTRNMNEGWSRNYVIEAGGEFASAASVVCQNRYSAMISGVCTLEQHHQKGYATKCLETLIFDLQLENKSLCLFYDNPDAGKIYKRLGFGDIDKWSLTELS